MKQISPTTWEVLPYFRAAQQKAGGVFEGIFPVLNRFIIYGAESFRRQPESIQYVLQLCEVCLSAHLGSKAQESKNAEAALIYQLLLQFEIGLQYIGPILTSVLLRYNKPISSQFLRIKLLNTVMCALSIDPQATMGFLASQQANDQQSMLAFVLDETCRIQEDYLHSYDKKVAIFGLCRVIQQESLLSEVVDRLKAIFEALIAILSSTGLKPQPQEEVVKLDQLFNREVTFAENPSHISVKGPSMSAMGRSNFDEREFNNTMSLFENPLFDNFDEYDCLRQMLSRLQSVNPDALRVLVSPLPQLRQEQLAELVQKRKLNTVSSSARRIVKAKHRAIS